jgi:uncharacterized membrane protein YkgB
MTQNTNPPPPKSDIEILLEELNKLLGRLNQNGQSAPAFELEILKVKSELLRLHTEGNRWAIENTDRVNMHNRENIARQEIHRVELDYQYKLAKIEESRSQGDQHVKLMSEAIGFAKITINSLVIVNAGAVLAILAFLGNVLKSGCTLTELDFLMSFIKAVAFAIATAMAAYLCQITFIEAPAPWNNRVGNILRVAGIILAIGAFCNFCVGASAAKTAFEKGQVFKCTTEQVQKIEIQALPDIKMRTIKIK